MVLPSGSLTRCEAAELHLLGLTPDRVRILLFRLLKLLRSLDFIHMCVRRLICFEGWMLISFGGWMHLNWAHALGVELIESSHDRLLDSFGFLNIRFVFGKELPNCGLSCYILVVGLQADVLWMLFRAEAARWHSDDGACGVNAWTELLSGNLWSRKLLCWSAVAISSANALLNCGRFRKII